MALSIVEDLSEWMKDMLVSANVNCLESVFDYSNDAVSSIAGEVSKSPQAWNGSIFSMIQGLSENVMTPIAGIVLTIVMCIDLLHMIMDSNNMNAVDFWSILKWVFKTAAACLIVTNTWNIVMAVFEVAGSVVNRAGGVISGSTAIRLADAIPDVQSKLQAMSVGELLITLLQSFVVSIGVRIMGILIFIVINGRMIEIYLTTSIAPIPMATMMGREWGGMGMNYLRSILALGFQGFFIMICVGIYSVLIHNITATANISYALWTCLGYTVLLALTLIKTDSIAKGVFSAR